MNLAPIVLFVYNRPWHTQQTVKALQQNELAHESELYIYSDAPREETERVKVNEVRRYIHEISGFKDIIILEREKNFGLADNIIDGVTDIVNKYGKIIVLEDDLVTSKYFLKYMNKTLDFYKNINDVWHISGWNYPINTDGLDDTFLWRVMNCWGWATWADRWSHFHKNANELVETFSKRDIKRFNADGYIPYWNQVKENLFYRIDTWAVFWYSTIFKNKGLCLNPSKSLIRNIGHDGTGLHSGNNKIYAKQRLLMYEVKYLPMDMVENPDALKRIKRYLVYSKVYRKVSLIQKLFAQEVYI